MQPVAAAIVARRRRRPPGEQLRGRLPDLDGERTADVEPVAGARAPTPAWTCRRAGTRESAASTSISAKNSMKSPAPGRARLGEVAPLGGEAGDLEHVEDVVHVELGQVIRPHRAHEVAVTADVPLLAVEQLVHVGIAAGAEQVVAAGRRRRRARTARVSPVIVSIGRR